MATRVTPTDVKVIIATTLADPVIQVWIDAANAIVNQQSACIGGDEALLTQIELQLSAHFVALVDPSSDRSKATSEKIGPLDVNYNSATLANNINDTAYGKAANMLSNGCLIQTTQANATVEFF